MVISDAVRDISNLSNTHLICMKIHNQTKSSRLLLQQPHFQLRGLKSNCFEIII